MSGLENAKLEHLVTYCRVRPVAKNGSAYLVDVRMTVPNIMPPYCIGKHLEIVTEHETFKIYNPQAVAFELSQLMSVMETFFRLGDYNVVSWRIVG